MIRKVLIVDDNVYKKIDIQRVVRNLGAERVDWERSLETALLRLEQEKEAPYDLIITDMNFPEKAGGDPYYRSGVRLIDALAGKGIRIPVILCSSVRYSVGGVAGCVWYSELRDLEADFRECVKSIGD